MKVVRAVPPPGFEVRGGQRPPLPPGSCVLATLPGALLKALQTNIAILFRKMNFQHFSLHFLSIRVSDICTGVDNVSMKGVNQAGKKLTSMVRSMDCKFLEHDVPAQLLLISSNRSEPCLLSGE